MTAIPKKFGFIRTTLALWAANLFPGRAGVVTDAPMGSSTSETWGWYDGSAWKYAARRGGDETFGTLTLNGAIRPTWHANFVQTLQTGPGTALAVYSDAIGDGIELWSNLFFDGTYKTVNAKTSSYPTRVAFGNGAMSILSSSTQPTAGGTVADMAVRFQVNRFGGVGLFGATAPTTRPTVNAACTDLATCIALTNQLRTHLIACGLVQ